MFSWLKVNKLNKTKLKAIDFIMDEELLTEKDKNTLTMLILNADKMYEEYMYETGSSSEIGSDSYLHSFKDKFAKLKDKQSIILLFLNLETFKVANSKHITYHFKLDLNELI